MPALARAATHASMLKCLLPFSHLTRVLILLSIILPQVVSAQVPEWIWTGLTSTNNEVRFFRKTFVADGKVKQAVLSIAPDDEADVWINGQKLKTVKGWNSATSFDVTSKVKSGQNVIAVRAFSSAGEAAFIAKLNLIIKREPQLVVTDTSWRGSSVQTKGWQSPEFAEGPNWKPVVSRGALGIQPWGEVMKVAEATKAEDLTISKGFKVELLHSAQPGQGTWIAMGVDPKGRFIVSPQGDLPLMRITVGKTNVSEIETIDVPLHNAMGLLWSHNSLYANAQGPNGNGLYRLIDANKNDRFEPNEVHFLKKFQGEGEHGYHAVVEGPDGKIYVMNGNHTKVPEGISPRSPHQHYDEDFLLPRQWDAGGHAVGILAPGGYVVRTDAEGKNWELMLAGFRNTYDFGFNAEGEMFAFDSDMEWEWGMPWYRPTRIIHCVSGGEYGWRSGSAKWPEYYADSLPATLDIAIGSPTGTKFGTKSNFPDKYKRAFYAMDWSYGRIFAVHLTPKGASYDATYETFVKGKPLNVTDLEFGKDGAMYFITGGRGTQAGLYRVSYVGGLEKEKRSREQVAAAKEAKYDRDLRHALETFHGTKNPKAIEAAWPFLGSPDRFIRYAARIAVESQDVDLWKAKALQENNAEAGLTALLALARVGGKGTQNDLLMALRKFPFDSLTEEQKLEKLRVIELSFIRQGKPEPQLAKLATEKLSHIYPNANYLMNRELVQLLVFLEAPDVVEKTFSLYDKAETHEERLQYIFALRNLKTGWTIDQRRKFFEFFKQDFTKVKHPPQLVKWFQDAGRDYSDGASFFKQLANIKKDAIANLSESEKTELADLISDNATTAETKPVKVRKFVKEWSMLDLENALDAVSSGRNFENGKTVFRDAQCIQCHRFGNEGGLIGPELTAASSKYSRKDILDSILQPSKVVSEQYQNMVVVKKDGDDFTGRIVDENDQKIFIATNPLDLSARTEIKKSDVARREPAKLSPMPEGLLNTMTKEDILDLLAYIESMGKAKAANFSKDAAKK